MKTTLNLFIVLATLVSAFSAQAYFRPGWERPLYKASLVEMDQSGHEIGIGLEKNLIMNKQDGAKEVTTFSFTEEVRVMCITAPCPPIKQTAQFVVASKTTDGCGSVVYSAYEGGPVLHHQIAKPKRVLTVTDHSKRICADYRKYLWDVTVTHPMGNAILLRTLFGNPEGVVTPQ